MPPDDQVGDPSAQLDGKIGNWDVLEWRTDDGARFLFTWAFRQNLLFQACCDRDAADHLEGVAVQTLRGLREHAPARCAEPQSDLSRESLIANLSGHDSRMFDAAGCPVRLDIVRMETLAGNHHCWPDLGVITIGTPLGSSTKRTARRSYVRDPDGLVGRATLTSRLDLDTDLPSAATDSGYRQNDRALWLDPADDSVIYVVTGDTVEAWPRHDEPLECA